MNNLREKLAETIMGDRAVDNWGNPLPCDYDLADAIIAALPDMVVPLVWIESGSDSFMHDADFVDATQTYQIQEGIFWYAAEVHGTPCGSNEAAKAAAQAHHRATILAAFGVQGVEA